MTMICLRRLSIAVFIFLFCSQSSVAGLMLQDKQTEMLDSFSLSMGGYGDALAQVELKQIVDLFKEGKPKEAKLKLASVLFKRPNDPAVLEVAGTLLLADKNYAAAQTALERALKADRRRVSAAAKLGVTYLMLGNHEKAEKIFRTTVSVAPNQPLALGYLAWFEGRKGNIGNSVAYLERVVATSDKGRLTVFHVNLAEQYDIMGRYGDALAVLNSVKIVLKPDVPTVNIVAGMLKVDAYFGIGDVVNSRKLLAKLEKLVDSNDISLRLLKISMAVFNKKPVNEVNDFRDKLIKDVPESDAVIYYRLARNYLTVSDYKMARNSLKAVIQFHEQKNDMSGLMVSVKDLVGLLMGQKLNSEALAVLDIYVKKFPESPLFKYQQAEVLLVAGRNKPAKKKLEGLLSNHPDYLPAYLLLSRIAKGAKDYAAAEKYLRDGLKVDNSSEVAWVDLANILFLSNKFLDAENVLNKGLSILPHSSALRFELAYLMGINNKRVDANGQYKKILEREPFNLRALDNLASNLLEQSEELVLAKELALRAYNIQKNDPYIQDLWGLALLRTGEHEKAREILKVASNNMKKNGQANYHLGLVYVELNDSPKANKQFNIALQKGVQAPVKEKINSLLK